jgi:hypothetical protein
MDGGGARVPQFCETNPSSSDVSNFVALFDFPSKPTRSSYQLLHLAPLFDDIAATLAVFKCILVA